MSMDARLISDEVVKITQSLGFLLSLDENHRMNKLKLVKLIWAADRYHIRKYGRTVTDTEYFALAHGPVSSLTLDVIDNDEVALYPEDISYISEHITPWESNKNEIVLYNKTEDDYLSETDKEALGFAWNTFGDKKPFELADDITHKYPEWSKFREHFDINNERSRKTIDLDDFFKNPDDDQYFNTDSAVLSASKEIYIQNQTDAQLLS
jgi:uncharacterized phage-associated protein